MQFFIKVYGNMNILWSQFLWYLKFVISSKLFTIIIYSVKLIAYVIVFTAVSIGTLSPEYLWLVLIELVLNELRKVSVFSAFHFSFDNQSSILKSLLPIYQGFVLSLSFLPKSDKLILYPFHTLFSHYPEGLSILVEAAVRRCSSKQVPLKISLYSQKSSLCLFLID